MFIAGAKIILDFFGNQNLKKKRDELDTLLKELRRKFNISAGEVEDFEDYERCIFGVSLVASSEKAARAAMKNTLEYIDSNSFARVVMEDSEIFEIL